MFNLGFTVLAPYPESAINAISKYLNDVRLLDNYLHPSRFVNRAVGSLISAAGFTSLANRLNRNKFSSTFSYGVLPYQELFRLIERLLPNSILRRDLMYRQKLAFALAAARRLEGYSGIIVGMAAACEEVFGATPKAYHVFHQVDSLPEVHNQTLERYFPKTSCVRELVPSYVEERVRREVSMAKLILAPSRFVASQHSANKNRKVITIPYGVDLPEYVGSARVARSGSGVKLLFVGQISLRKGVSILLEAFCGLSSKFSLTLVGPIVNSNLLRKLPKNVRYLGPRSSGEVRELMANVDAFVLPSVEDACALVIAEAVAAGLPVITTVSNGASELLDSKDVRLIQAGSVSSLRSAVLDVVPLNIDEAEQRARRIRADAIGGMSSIVDWQDYASNVVAMLLKQAANYK